MAKSLKEIWNDLWSNGHVKNVVWIVESRGVFAPTVSRTDAVKVEAAAELYHVADAFRKEIGRLRKVLVENELAEYDSDGNFVEKFTSDTPKNISN